MSKQEKVPREHRPEVQEILNNKELINFEKAAKIQQIDYNMACRESDGYVTTMTVSRIEQILNEREEK